VVNIERAGVFVKGWWFIGHNFGGFMRFGIDMPIALQEKPVADRTLVLDEVKNS